MKMNERNNHRKITVQLIKRSSLYMVSLAILFILIGFLTTISPAYRFSSEVVSTWTSKIETSTYVHLFSMENRAFQEAVPKDQPIPKISSTIFELATSIKPQDPRSLLGNELPGFSIFDREILIAGEGTNYTNLPIESSPPLEEVMKDREAILGDEPEDDKKQEGEKDRPTTGGKKVVYLYNTHNYESFLPHLPKVSDPNNASHNEVNITKVSDRLAKSLEAEGIGTQIETTDIMELLHSKNWKYGKSYQASREVVKEAIAVNKDIKYIFDIHRDSERRNVTTKKINGKDYARVMIVIGANYDAYKDNLDFATRLHYKLEEKYPGISRGVIPKKGKGTNGIFNQDLSDQAILFEFGGVDNTLEELYGTADALAEVFGEFYWDAEKVSVEERED
ncbi:stage II sporulation protein P [Paracerasibacillus soli]|uniref:Stage II sporulation protein P n=1 Tax=Paracerasibacillus soli TaxID=480284 RepID=A0ABU5CRQ0_9BACI|nr:stage II sporulation protein P [Virgibacillus soli]MDY0408492.1 stage II sporulation protein P [Virgibacillus soli]